MKITSLMFALVACSGSAWASECKSNLYDHSTICASGAVSSAYAAIRMPYDGVLQFDPFRPLLGAEYSPGGGSQNACDEAYDKALSLAQDDCMTRNPRAACRPFGRPVLSQDHTYCGVKVYVR